jgi:hypothetical protein
VCVSSPVDGEFSQLLSLQAKRRVLPYDEQWQVVQRICDLLDTQCLCPDDQDMNPYTMRLLGPGAAPAKVSLDPVALDEGRYVIVP